MLLIVTDIERPRAYQYTVYAMRERRASDFLFERVPSKETPLFHSLALKQGFAI